jgi:hypothetical protein
MAAQEAAVAWEGVEDELDTRERLAKAIREDPHRDLVEKETRFMTVKGSDRVDVYTAEKTLMRQFARHPLFVLDWVELSTGERSTETVQADELPSDLGRRSVYSLSGSVPVGVMLFKGEARGNNHHSDVVSHHGLIDLKEVGDQ